MPFKRKKNARKLARLHKGSKKHMNVKASQDLPVWDAVNETSINCRAFFVLPAQIVPLVRNPIYQSLVDMAQLTQLMTTLDNDVMAYKDRINAIAAKHNGRKGNAHDADDHMKALAISEEYYAWASSYESVILPTIQSITNIYAAAEKQLQQLAAQPSEVEQVLAHELTDTSNGETVVHSSIDIDTAGQETNE